MTTKAQRMFKFKPDEQVRDPKVALKIQLEMLQQRVALALQAVREGKRRNAQEQIKAVRQIAIAVHNLAYVIDPMDDARLVNMLRESKYSSESNVELVKDQKLVDIRGLFDIKKLSRRFLW